MTASASVACMNCSLYLTAQVLGLERLDRSMGEYLGLASETVIRVLQSLNNQRLINIKAKQISILNESGLESLLAPSD